MGWGIAAAAFMSYMQSRQQSKAAGQAAQPLPTYFMEYQSPEQKKMWEALFPTIEKMQAGPTAGWYEGLDPNVRAGIEEPYMKSMEMMREGLAGGGQLGAMGSGETPAFSGAAADVMGQYMQKAAPAMAKTGWDMMMGPYQGAMSLLPSTYSDLLVGHHPTFQQIQPGAPMPSGYPTQGFSRWGQRPNWEGFGSGGYGDFGGHGGYGGYGGLGFGGAAPGGGYGGGLGYGGGFGYGGGNLT